MSATWLFALMSRDELRRNAARIARRYKNMVSAAELQSAVDYGLSLAVAKFDPERGSFQDFAWRFVERAVHRVAQGEIRWRTKIADIHLEDTTESESGAEIDAWRRELEEILGADYQTFIRHFAWGESLREIGKAQNRSFRGVRESIARAERRIREHYGSIPRIHGRPRRCP